MVKIAKTEVPNAQHALELLAGTNPQSTRKKSTISSVAKVMSCSYYALRRVMNCVKRGHPVQSLSWCKGRKIKELNISTRQINWIDVLKKLGLLSKKNEHKYSNIDQEAI